MDLSYIFTTYIMLRELILEASWVIMWLLVGSFIGKVNKLKCHSERVSGNFMYTLYSRSTKSIWLKHSSYSITSIGNACKSYFWACQWTCNLITRVLLSHKIHFSFCWMQGAKLRPRNFQMKHLYFETREYINNTMLLV